MNLWRAFEIDSTSSTNFSIGVRTSCNEGSDITSSLSISSLARRSSAIVSRNLIALMSFKSAAFTVSSTMLESSSFKSFTFSASVASMRRFACFPKPFASKNARSSSSGVLGAASSFASPCESCEFRMAGSNATEFSPIMPGSASGMAGGSVDGGSGSSTFFGFMASMESGLLESTDLNVLSSMHAEDKTPSIRDACNQIGEDAGTYGMDGSARNSGARKGAVHGASLPTCKESRLTALRSRRSSILMSAPWMYFRSWLTSFTVALFDPRSSSTISMKSGNDSCFSMTPSASSASKMKSARSISP
mmetsp:Transcript_69837/g.194181  ORF Transcript_69837/g.194181 Transcript_69837/m.194181 type:complete len:305 (+) Transcript_69837:167-1081(+)